MLKTNKRVLMCGYFKQVIYFIFLIACLIHGHLSLRGKCLLFLKQIAILRCTLHVMCLCVTLEKHFGETMWSQGMLPPFCSQHVSSTILPLPRNRKLMGDASLPSIRKAITNLLLKFSKLV
jgi:hypothetical protein